MDLQTAMDLIRRDVTATLVDRQARAVVLAYAGEQLDVIKEMEWNGSKADHLVEDVQQLIHDLRIDTSWPRCPVHGNHPLWWKECRWTCEKGGVEIRLGGLSTR